MSPAKKRATRIWSHHLDVVGLRFRWTRDGRRALSDMIDKRGSITGVQLIREPDNRADENAIKVCLPERILQGKQLGYIRAQSAKMLAPKIDAGTLKVHDATLLNLRAEDDWNEGELHVRFRDVAKPKKAKRRKDAKRVATSAKRQDLKRPAN